MAGAWVASEGVPVGAPSVTKRGRAGGGPALVVAHDGKAPRAGVAHYGADIDVLTSASYEVSAWMKRTGDADLVVQWVGRSRPQAGATAVTETVRVGTPEAADSWAQVKRVLSPPKWAQLARVGVRVRPGASASVDDVRLEAKGGGLSPAQFSAGRSVDASVTSAGHLHLQKTATVLLVGGAPWAKTADGRVLGGPAGFEAKSVRATEGGGATVEGVVRDEAGSLPATVVWTRGDEGLSAKVTVEGADSVGLSVDLPRPHLEAEGVSALGTYPPARLEAKAGPTLDGTRKVLAGDPASRTVPIPGGLFLKDGGEEREVSFSKDEEGTTPGAGVLTDVATGDTWPVVHEGPGKYVGRGSFTVVERKPSDGVRPPTLLAFAAPAGTPEVRFDVLDAEDPGQLRLAFWRKGAEGEFAIVAEFEGERVQARTELSRALDLVRQTPGTGIRRLREVAQSYPFDKDVRGEALAKAAEAEEAARKAIGELADALERADVFRSVDAIEEAEAKARALSAQFPGTEGTFEPTVADLAGKARALRARYDLARATPEVKRLVRLAQLLEEEKGFASLAAVYYEDVATRYAGLEAAQGEGAEVAALVKQARERFQALVADAEVRKAVPARPGATPEGEPK